MTLLDSKDTGEKPWPPEVEERLMSKVAWNGDEDECWTWQGAQMSGGYGIIQIAGAAKLTHRVSHEVFKGPIPEGLHIDHLCRTRLCINPAHLEAVTNVENIMRGEGFFAKNARVTHCPKGHPYAGENLLLTPEGYRLCRQCKRESKRVWQREYVKANPEKWAAASRQRARKSGSLPSDMGGHKRGRIPWESWEEDLVMAHEETNRELALRLGRTANSIQVRRNQIKRRLDAAFSKEEGG